MSKTIGGVKTTYLVDDVANPTGYAQVVEERIKGVVQVAYGYGPMRAWAKYPAYQYGDANGQGADPARYYGYDGHGSVRMLTDEVGTVTDKYDYDAFGNIITQTSSPSGARDGWGRVVTLPVANTMLFAGEQFDPDLGLYYNRARYLDTRVGRFWGMDTYQGSAQNPISLHRYTYANANPVDLIDATGLYSQQFGYDVEDVVESAYEQDYGVSSAVTFGKWSRLSAIAYCLKPDILDLRAIRGDGSLGNIWMEIKPLSLSGLVRAGASYTTYSAAFGQLGINPDGNWLRGGRIFTVVSKGTAYETLVFNAGGILFYTTSKNDYDRLQEMVQSAVGISVAATVGAVAGKLVSVITSIGAEGSELVHINNLVRFGIHTMQAEAELDEATTLIPAA